MPTYESRCKKCGTSFERQEQITEHEKSHPLCSNGKSEAVEPVRRSGEAISPQDKQAIGFRD